MAVLHVLYSTSTGHTEYVVDTLIAALGAAAPRLTIEKQCAEAAQATDLLRGDALLLASGTWNTGGTEGQLHPRMSALLKDRAQDCDLQKKPCAVIALGDERYYYTARAMEHLMQFVTQHGGQVAESLVIVNEPYGQEEKVNKWAAKLLAKVPALVS
ncbi:MAG: flavodoxin domain-containing protein [Candidatus Peribacteraceae bacterium]|nr:flavodoxin domain-containing protein [Candidatus Peribacteraceae bacterium]